MPNPELPEMQNVHAAQQHLTPPLKFGDLVQIKAHKVWVGHQMYRDLMEEAWLRAKQHLLDTDVREAQLELDEYVLGITLHDD
jgi:hypothetical protein